MLVMMLAQFCNDFYLPALPNIAKYFEVSHNWVQWSVAIFFLSYAVSQLIWGALSDYYGRRPVILVGLLFAFVGSVLCYYALSIQWLLLGRFVQGFGMGAMIGRALICDLFSGKALAKMLSLLSMINISGVAFAPAVGGYIVHFYHWQRIFLVLAVSCIVVFILAMFSLDETLAKSVKFKFKDLVSIVRDEAFIKMSLIGSLLSGALFAMLTAAPFLCRVKLGMSAENFGWALFINAMAYVLGAWWNRRLLARFDMQSIATWSCGFSLVVLFLAVTLWVFDGLSLLALLPFLLITFLFGFMFPNVMAKAVGHIKESVGLASSLLTTISMGGAFVFSSWIAWLNENSQGELIMLLGITLVGAFILLVRKK